MKSLGSVISTMSNRQEVTSAVKEGKRKVLTDPDVQYFLNQNSTKITEEVLNRDILRLSEYVDQKQSCVECNSLEACPNLMKGYKNGLSFKDGQISNVYSLCDRGIVAVRKRQMENLIQTVHVPVNVRKANFNEYETGEKERDLAVAKAINFVESYQKNKFIPGLYLHGAFGTGKSFLLGAIANRLAEQGVSSAIVHWSDFLREVKGSFGDNTTNHKIEALRKVPVLLIDDIGSESNSPWSRDDVLGTTLQYRMDQNLPTCFSSNFSLEELEQHFAFTQNGGEEKVKTKRIMERIRYLTTEVSVVGRNRRNRNL